MPYTLNKGLVLALAAYMLARREMIEWQTEANRRKCRLAFDALAGHGEPAQILRSNYFSDYHNQAARIAFGRPLTARGA